MNADPLASVIHEAFRTLATVGVPILGILLGVGLLVGILQSATQVNDAAVGFLPKFTATLLAVALLGPWMVSRLAQFLVLAMQHLAAGG